MNKLQKEQLSFALDILESHLRALQAVYLFGSFGTPFQRADSDLDLAFLSSESFSSIDLWEIAQIIARKIQRDVDLVELKSASTLFCYQVITEGTVVKIYQKKACDEFELQMISRHCRFNEARREILEHFVNSTRQDILDG